MTELVDCGIDWIGKIPKGWNIRRLCYLIDQYKAGPFGSALIMDKLMDDGQILVYTPEVIAENRTDLPNNKYLPEERKKEMHQFQVQPGDIIFPIVGSLGRAMLISDEHPKGIINQRLAKFRVSSADLTYSYFLWLFARSSFYSTYIELNSRGSIIANLTKAILHDMPVLIPPKPEQEIITTFLDNKCAEIDSLATDIQSQIDTLEQYKRSIVFEAVSKGIQKAKANGIVSDVWGALPEGWSLVDIKYLFDIVKRIAGKEGYDVLSVTQKGLRIKDIESNDGQQADNYSDYQLVYPTDYVMNQMDLLTGWVDCSTMHGVTSPDYRVFKLSDRKKNSLTYYKYVMQCCYMCRIFYSIGQGVSNLGRWRLQTATFRDFKVPVPPLVEQEEIASFLEHKCTEIDLIVATKRQQLHTMEEYRRSLIFEYVTGKKEVTA